MVFNVATLWEIVELLKKLNDFATEQRSQIDGAFLLLSSSWPRRGERLARLGLSRRGFHGDTRNEEEDNLFL
jgi:hypothetical protein